MIALALASPVRSAARFAGCLPVRATRFRGLAPTATRCRPLRGLDPVAEGCEGQSWKGVVDEVPDVVVARRLHPEDPARSTDTRVLRVGIALREPTPIKLEQRVDCIDACG